MHADRRAAARSCEPVAVVGMSGRFPDAASPAQLWQMLMDRGVGIRRLERDVLLRSGIDAAIVDNPAYMPVGTHVEGVDRFDARFFGINDVEARLIDPQHRVFLECVHAALDDAAFDGTQRVGLFGGCLWSTYLFSNVIPMLCHQTDEGDGRHGRHGQLAPPKAVMIANDKDFLCTRVSYRLGLTGPSVSVQTACSTSLVATHLACRSLQSGESDVAVAGGVGIALPQPSGYFPDEDPTFSQDGRCRPFDAEASGMVMGNGCAVVVLKRLADALADRDHIYAVVRGTVIGNDGSAKVGYTAPSVAGLRTAIRTAIETSGVEPERIGYVEMHASGTWMGDCVEIRALSDAYGSFPTPAADRVIGSVKANVGNLAMAAGATALIKTALILDQQTIPPQAGFDIPHPQLHLDDLPFTIPTAVTRRNLDAAAVTATGGGGTNVHCVLERAPAHARSAPAPGDYVVGISAPNDEGLRRVALSLRGRLAESPALRIDDIAYTLATGRRRLAHRLAFVAKGVGQLSTALDCYLAGDGTPEHPLAREWTQSAEPDPARLGSFDHARHIPLPGYPLDPQRHWIDAP